MYLLMPVKDIHPITDEQVGVAVELVELTLTAVNRIREDSETGFATIYYKSGEVLETLCPFVIVLGFLTAKQVVDYSAAHLTTEHSEAVKTFIDQSVRFTSDTPVDRDLKYYRP